MNGGKVFINFSGLYFYNLSIDMLEHDLQI